MKRLTLQLDLALPDDMGVTTFVRYLARMIELNPALLGPVVDSKLVSAENVEGPSAFYREDMTRQHTHPFVPNAVVGEPWVAVVDKEKMERIMAARHEHSMRAAGAEEE